MKKNKIRGIQIKGKLLISNENVHYITNFKEMTIDTDDIGNIVFTRGDLLKILKEIK
jgi:hypothetical protein